jgi:phage tail-like protein
VRSVIPGLETPHPLGWSLPAVFHEDPLMQLFLTAFDDVLAPIFCTLDNLDAYFDPHVAPPDFLPWLASWVGADLDDNWPLERQRSLAGRAASLYRWRGTVKGLAAELTLHTGWEPEIEESGACVWSSLPGTRTPGTADGHVRIRVRVPDPSRLNMVKLHTMISNAIPADITYALEVEQLQFEQPADSAAEPAQEPAAEPPAEPPALAELPDIEVQAPPDVDDMGGTSDGDGVGLVQPGPEVPPESAKAPPEPSAEASPETPAEPGPASDEAEPGGDEPT